MSEDIFISIEEESIELIVQEPEVIQITVSEAGGVDGDYEIAGTAQALIDGLNLGTAAQADVGDFEPAIGSKGSAFNKNFGTGAQDVMPGNTSIPTQYTDAMAQAALASALAGKEAVGVAAELIANLNLGTASTHAAEDFLQAPIEYILPPNSTGMGATSTPVADQAEAESIGTDGWYDWDSQASIDLLIGGVWQNASKTYAEVTTAPYVWGSQGEDVLLCNDDPSGDRLQYVTVPGNPGSDMTGVVTRPIKFVNNTGGTVRFDAQFINSARASVAKHWYNNGAVPFILSGSQADYFTLLAGLQGVEGLSNTSYPFSETNMISYKYGGSSGGWGNVPDVNNSGAVMRYTLTADQIARLGYTDAWFTGADAPSVHNFGSETPRDNDFYLQSNGDIYQLQSAVWVLMGNAATNTAASDVSYDNTSSGLLATNAQGAIDELDSAITGLPTATSSTSFTHKTLNDSTNYIDADATHARVFLALSGAGTVGMPVTPTAWNTTNQCAEVGKAVNTSAAPCLGILESSGADGTVQSCRTSGALTNVNTNAWSAGTVLYVDGAGVLTSTKPTTIGQYIKVVGTVLYQAAAGVIEVKIEAPQIITAAASGGDGGFAFKYTFDTATTGSPTSGSVQLDATTANSATTIHVNEIDATGVDIDRIIDLTNPPDFIMLSNADRTKQFTFQQNAIFFSGAGVDSLPVTFKTGHGTPAGNMTFTNGETVYLSFMHADFDDVYGQALCLNRCYFRP